MVLSRWCLRLDGSMVNTGGVIRTLAAFLSVMVLGFTMSLPLTLPAQAAEGDIAIEVEDETMTKQEVQREIDRAVQRMKKRNQRAQKNNGQSAPDEMRKQVRERVKQRLVNRMVLRVHAKKSGIEVTSDDIDQRWQKLVQRFGSEEELKKAIERAGQTVEELRQRIRESEQVRKFVEQNTESTDVTEEELRQFFEENKGMMGDAEFDQIKDRLRGILKQRKQQQARQKLIEKLKEQTDITINV